MFNSYFFQNVFHAIKRVNTKIYVKFMMHIEEFFSNLTKKTHFSANH